jgi:hypothetical protein
MRCLAAFLLCSWLSFAHADSLNFYPDRDNTIYEDEFGATSNGAGSWFFVGNNAADQARRGLLRFNVAPIPAGATITMAQLTLQMTRTTAPGTEITIHRVLADWGAAGSNATSNEGRGAPALPGDCTWLHRFVSDQFWTTPGGDYDPTALAMRSVGDVGAYTWSSTPALVASVQSWLDNPASNFGWLLHGDESGPRTSKRFGTMENTIANRPVLHVEYTIPEPASAAILLLGLACGGRRSGSRAARRCASA